MSCVLCVLCVLVGLVRWRAEEHPITKVIGYAKAAGLQVILDLHTAPGSQNGKEKEKKQGEAGAATTTGGHRYDTYKYTFSPSFF